MSTSTVAEPAVLGTNATTGHAITDRCVKVLESEEEKKDTKESCCSELHKKMTSYVQDPVQTFHSSVGWLGFFLLFVCGVVIAVIDGTISEDSEFMQAMGVIAAVFVALMALFVTIFLGGDLFMFEALKKVVDDFGKQLKRLRASRTFYEGKLKDLAAVSTGMESVCKQMEDDVTGTTNLLTDMERLGKLQTVAAVMNQFFSADYDGSGQIKGQEAEILFNQITFLWELVPGFDHVKVVKHVSENGLTIAQLSVILDALVVHDQSACTDALQALCGPTDDTDDTAEETGDTAAAIRPSPFLKREKVYESLDDLDGYDLESQPIAPSKGKQRDLSYGTAPPPDNTDADGMKPLFTVPTLLPVLNLWFVSIGGNCSVWGYWHLAALICVPINITFFVVVVIGSEVQDIILQTVGVCLALGLTGTGKLIEIIRNLRQDAKDFRVENDSLEICNEDLASKVLKLQKLKLGLEKLKETCGGNVEKAKELLHKSETKIKMQAMAFVTNLFKNADENRDMTLEGVEKETFFTSLEEVLHKLPGFNISVIRNLCTEDTITAKEIKEIVDAVARFESG